MTRSKKKSRALSCRGQGDAKTRLQAPERDERSKSVDDVETVHRIRVASRHIRADMPIFKHCLNVGEYKKWRSSTKGLARALGKTRDIDVQIEYLRSFLKRISEDAVPGVEALLMLKKEQRDGLQKEIIARLDRLGNEGTLKDMRDALSKMVKRLEGRGVSIHTPASFATALAQATMSTQKILSLERLRASKGC